MMRQLLKMMLFLSAFSCGKSDGTNSDTGTATPPAADAPQEETQAGGRYSSVMVQENCGFWTDCDFTIRADFTARPLLLTASFVDNGWPGDEQAPEENPIDTGTCTFVVTLSDAEAARLRTHADGLRVCTTRNTPTADRGFDGVFMTRSSGEEAMVYKFRDGGQEEEGDIKYLCGGRKAYYSYLRQLIVPRAPEECPDGYERLFR